ncbi:DNA-binding protein MNB1B [Brachypodium distachyon]|uniref:HMG box domain-containing protein n=1 Tax=Brachypodium distachyon TaxID=15368 RepID=A0A0Q3GSS9_BRADI|nr:DNA-binding protein MNB1B [Brachypodium distachyon]KQJ84066.1 hypothetical protein BRADI_5g18460v3 [Brachypodium distachyon]|eukprot:XP_003580334.1 DNA-binding protein MNB1B [Brachypodium distachyon]
MRSKSDGDASFKASGKRKKATGGVAKPKRAPTPFFAFLAEFRPQYMEKHPEAKGVAAVTKAAGEKWRSMSDEEKAKYGGKKQEVQENKAAKKKESTSSKKAKTDGDEEEGEGSDKSKSDVEDDGEEDGANEEDED